MIDGQPTFTDRKRNVEHLLAEPALDPLMFTKQNPDFFQKSGLNSVTMTALRIPHPARGSQPRGSHRASLQASFTPAPAAAVLENMAWQIPSLAYLVTFPVQIVPVPVQIHGNQHHDRNPTN